VRLVEGANQICGSAIRSIDGGFCSWSLKASTSNSGDICRARVFANQSLVLEHWACLCRFWGHWAASLNIDRLCFGDDCLGAQIALVQGHRPRFLVTRGPCFARCLLFPRAAGRSTRTMSHAVWTEGASFKSAIGFVPALFQDDFLRVTNLSQQHRNCADRKSPEG
jgi:hypothetical protein